MNFLFHHWNWYSTQVGTITAELCPSWCFNGITSLVFILLSGWWFHGLANLFSICKYWPGYIGGCYLSWLLRSWFVFMLVNLSTSHCRCSFFPGSTRLGKVVASGLSNSSLAGDGNLKSIVVALIYSRASWLLLLFFRHFAIVDLMLLA